MAMIKANNSGCSLFLRIILAVMNFIIFAIGVTLIACAAVFKYSHIVKTVMKTDALSEFIKINAIDGCVIALLVIGCLSVVLSFIGFIAAATLNRVFLGIYEFLLIIILLAHAGIAIALIVRSTQLKNRIKSEFIIVVQKLRSDQTETAEKLRIFSLMKEISKTFTCCGIKGPDDFGENASMGCVDISVKNGCGVELINFFESKIYSLLIPSIIVLFFELITVVIVPVLFYRVSREI